MNVPAASDGNSILTVSPPSQTVNPVPVTNQPVRGGPETASGGIPPYTFAVASGSLPPGYSLSAAGVWSGTVTTPGTFTARIRATDSVGNTGYATYVWPISIIVINPASTTISVAIGAPVSGALSATGGHAPYIFSVISGALPPGYIMSGGGGFSGTATTAGRYSATIRAMDTGSGFSDVTYVWVIQ